MENKNNTFLGLRRSPRITKLDFRNGKISKYTGKGRPREEFDYAEGRVTGISTRTKESPKGKIDYIDVACENGEHHFILSAIASSGAAADLVGSIAKLKDPNAFIRIDAWPLGRVFTKVSVEENGETVKCPHLFKERREVRDKLIARFIDEVNKKLREHE